METRPCLTLLSSGMRGPTQQASSDFRPSCHLAFSMSPQL